MPQVSLAEVPQALESAFAADPANAARAREQANVAALNRMLGAIAAGDFETLHGLLAPDVTLEIAAPDGVPWVRRAAGADAVAAAVAQNFSTVREQRPEPLALVAQGDEVMVMARETGRWAEGGAPYEVLVAHHFSFRDGKLAAFHSVSAPNRRDAGS